MKKKLEINIVFSLDFLSERPFIDRRPIVQVVSEESQERRYAHKHNHTDKVREPEHKPVVGFFQRLVCETCIVGEFAFVRSNQVHSIGRRSTHFEFEMFYFE